MRQGNREEAWTDLNAEVEKQRAAGRADRYLPLIADEMGICPRLLIGPTALTLAGARAWWDKGALGMTYISAPSWVIEGFSIYESALCDAMKFKRENVKQ